MIRVGTLIVAFLMVVIPIFNSAIGCNTEMEQLSVSASDLTIQTPDVPSKIAVGLMVRGEELFMCPTNTNIILKEFPQHHEPFSCDGHTFVVYGNAVFIIE